MYAARLFALLGWCQERNGSSLQKMRKWLGAEYPEEAAKTSFSARTLKEIKKMVSTEPQCERQAQ